MAQRFTRLGDCSRFCGRCCGIHGFKGHPDYDAYKKEWQEDPFPGLTKDGTCKAFKWEKGLATCGVYETRPQICKDFPDRPSEISTIPDCSFTFILKPAPFVKRPDPVHPNLMLRWFEPWPLFDVQKTILKVPITKDGQVVRHEERTYVIIQELPDLTTRPNGIQHLIAEIRRLEWKCWNQGIAGLLAGTDIKNLTMQGIIVGYGARLYQRTDTTCWFVKRITEPPKMTGKGIDARSVLPSYREMQIGAQAYVRSQVDIQV